jgi:hypothetical protein
VPFSLNKEIYMKKLLLTTIGLCVLTACQQLQHGQMQPVKQLSEKEKTYFTTCAGAVEGWTDCYEKAALTCNKNYTVLDKVDDSRGTRRDLTFKCN